MKKTIIALLALAGVANATSSVPQIYGGADAIDELEASIKVITNSNQELSVSREYYYDYVYGKGDVTNNGTVSFSGNYTVGVDGSFTTSSANSGANFKLNGIFDVNCGDVTISFTADLTAGSAGNILTFGETSSWCYHLGVDTNGNLTGLTSTGYATPETEESTTCNLVGSHDYVLSWASPANFGIEGAAEKDRVFTLFVDGEMVLQAAADNQNYGSAWEFSYTFGDKLNATFSNVEVHRGAIMIPEPATATLSLLALAGLAARRRRK